MHSNIIAALLLLVTLPSLFGQDRRTMTNDPPSPQGVLVSLKGGVVVTSPRQIFPSIRVGETGQGTGEISSRERGERGTGSRIGLELMIPISQSVGITADFANLLWSVRVNPTATTLPVQFDVQTLTVGLGLQGNVYTNRDAFLQEEGLRGIYLGGKLDIGIATVNNRVEAYSFSDSSGVPFRAVGSFDNSDPFRNGVAFVIQGGGRYGVGSLEITGEASYSFALNSVFSSLVVVDNEFSVDHLAFQIGIGYRW